MLAYGWLIDPDDLTLAVYRLESGRYADPIRVKLEGQTPLSAVPGVIIDWDQALV